MRQDRRTRGVQEYAARILSRIRGDGQRKRIEEGISACAWYQREPARFQASPRFVRSFCGGQGVREADFVPLVRQTVSAHRRRVYRYTRDLVASLRRRGYYLLAVSHSPKYLVDDFARELGFDKIYGRVLELDPAGRFTGRALHLDVISSKAKVLGRAIEKEGLTLAGSVGVGDTEADVGFLEMVERPICFNPNAALFRVAKRRGWKVVVERKDVVHEIQTGVQDWIFPAGSGR